MFVNSKLFLLPFLALSAIYFLFPIPLSANSVSDIVINEIAWMGIKENSYAEWIELYNNTDQEINLSGYTITTDNGLNIVLASSVSAKNYFLLLKQTTGAIPKAEANQTYSGKSLRNKEGERLVFKNKDGNLIEEINCSQGWFAGKDNPEYQTMERKNSELSGNDINNWQNSALPDGTPKEANSSGASIQEERQDESSPESTPFSEPLTSQSNQPPQAEAGQDVIALINQEITFDGSKSQDPQSKSLTYFWNFGDGSTSDKQQANHLYKYPGSYIASLTVNNGEKSSDDTLTVTIYSNSIIISEFIPNPAGDDKNNEWIELYNDSAQIADLSKWQISTQNPKAKHFIFPDNSLIAGQQHIILSSDITKISLNNNEGSVKLSFPNSQVAQEIKYSKAKEKQSIALSSNSQYLWTTSPTPGTANVITSAVKTAETNSSTPFTAQESSPEQQNIIPANAYQPQSAAEGTFVTAGQIAGNSDNASENNSQPPLPNKTEINSPPQAENQNAGQKQTASLANKISSPIYLFLLITVLGLGGGWGLIKIRRKIKARSKKNPIDR